MKQSGQLLLFIFLTAAPVFMSSTVYGKQAVSGPCEVKILPAKVQEILQQKFPSWRILALTDLSGEDQRFWTRSEKRNDCPGMAFGHYEVKTALTYVLSLVPRSEDSMGYRLVVFRPDGSNHFKEEVLEKNDGTAYPLIVYTVSPGRYWNDERTKSVQLSLEGFQTEEKEKGAFLYFWEQGTLHQWTVSE